MHELTTAAAAEHRAGWHNKDGSTPLCIAVQAGHLEIVKILLGKGANPNIDAMGFTPLGIAEKNGHKEIAELLRKAGAK